MASESDRLHPLLKFWICHCKHGLKHLEHLQVNENGNEIKRKRLQAGQRTQRREPSPVLCTIKNFATPAGFEAKSSPKITEITFISLKRLCVKFWPNTGNKRPFF